VEAHPGPLEISRSKSLWMSWKRQTLEENKHQATAKRYLNALFKMSRPEKGHPFINKEGKPYSNALS